MKREELKALELTDEQVNAVMKMYGKINNVSIQIKLGRFSKSLLTFRNFFVIIDTVNNGVCRFCTKEKE